MAKIISAVLLFCLFGLLVSGTRRTAYKQGMAEGCNHLLYVAPIMKAVSKKCLLKDGKLTVLFRDDSTLDLEELYE